MKPLRAPFDLPTIAGLAGAAGLVALVLLGCGCAHIPKGGATEAHVSFGIPSVFAVKQDLAGVKATDKTVRAESASTEISVLLFVWKSSAKDVILTNPTDK